MEIAYGNTPFLSIGSLYTFDGKTSDRQLFKVMQWILTEVMHWISIKVIQKLVNKSLPWITWKK